jgi:inosine-uridine nucleoside N-ribohydrolase
MGGSTHSKGNSGKASEVTHSFLTFKFNFHYDPEAAHVVLNAAQSLKSRTEPLIKIVPWETTVDHAFSWSLLDSIVERSDDSNKLVCLLKGYTANARSMAEGCNTDTRDASEFSRYTDGVQSFLLCDMYCMVGMLDRSCILEFEDVHLEVELDGTRSRGSMLIDWFTRLGGKKEAGATSRVLLKLDKDLIVCMIDYAFLGAYCATLKVRKLTV